MEIRGRDPATESYRIEVIVDGKTVTALLPERLAASLRDIGPRPSHQTAYEWIAQHKTRIEAAITRLARDGPPTPPPFDQISLVKES